MAFEGLHETVIKDITDTIKDGISSAEDIGIDVSRPRNRLDSAKSLSHATEGLILVFPHICSLNVSPETASMLTKAIETKAVSLLQIAFSAFNITNSQDAVDFVRQFHTNIGSGKMSIDKFIDTMDSITTESGMRLVDRDINRGHLVHVLEEFKKMECYFEDDISESSINDFKVVNRYGNYVIMEDKPINPPKPSQHPTTNWTNKSVDKLDAERDNEKYLQGQIDIQNIQNQTLNAYNNDRNTTSQIKDREANQKRAETQLKHNIRQDARNDKLAHDKFDHQKDMDFADLALKQQKNDMEQFRNDFDMLTRQILPSDIKKANEMVPTMMVINFVTRDERLQTPIRSQAVIGVKAKLYPASSDDIINKIIIKNADTNTFLKLMRVSTRELNFIRDFLLAIDDAKLSAISCSTNGSDINRLLKILERRAVKGKVRRRLNMRNAYKSITTITISKDEADFIKRYNNIDVFNPSVIRKIMETLNIMMFIIADDTEECAHIIMDSGEDIYEKIAYGHLERESTDGSYKKAINLMTKVVR